MRRSKDSKEAAARITPIHALLAAAILGLLVMPLAFAGASSGPEATAAKVTDAKFKKLKKRVAALESEGATPSGSAGGDLAGTYPNPAIRNTAVTTAKLADNAVTTPKLADNAVTTAEIADDAVTGGKLGTLVTVTNGISDSDGVLNDNFWTRGNPVTATCPAGATLLSGGVTQIGTGTALGPEVAITRSAPTVDGTGWIGSIISDAQGLADPPSNFVVRALCLQV